MRRLVTLLLCLACLCATAYGQRKSKADKEAERLEIVKAIQSQNFNVVLTRNVPRNSNEPVQNYPAGQFTILVRGDEANVYIPGVNNGGIATFGGGNVGGVEVVRMSCRKVSEKKGVHTFVLRNLAGKASYEIKIRACENTCADIIVDMQPTSRWKFYGEIAVG